jgi:hypothetical protein
MYICVCVYVGMGVCVCMYVCMYICMYVYVCMYVYMYVCIYVCMYVYVRMGGCVCMYVCMCVYVRMGVYVCVCVRTYGYVCIVCVGTYVCMYESVCIWVYVFMHTYRVSQEEFVKLREVVPYVKIYRYNPKHLCPKLNGCGEKCCLLWGFTHCTCQLTVLCMPVLQCGVILQQFSSRYL